MKYKWLYILGSMLLVAMVYGSAPAGAVYGTGEHYATPSWDQTLPAFIRFVVLLNMNGEAVLDKETGLVWEQSPDGVNAYTWEEAQSHCNALETGGRMGWRLPTLQELASLVDPMRSNPALPMGSPFRNVQLSDYWSATTSVRDTSDAWVVSFGTARLTFHVDNDTKNKPLPAWCVRGGRGVDPQ